MSGLFLKEYPHDGGVFSPLLLNLLYLQPGDAIYRGADIPHAYLQGTCVCRMKC